MRFVVSGGRRRGRRVVAVAPPPVDPEGPITLAGLLAPSAGMLADAMDPALAMLRYSIEPGMTSDDTGGSQTNRQFSLHCVLVIALAALAGDTTVIGGQTAAQKLLAQLIWWTEDGQDRMPVGDAGYKTQYEIFFCAVVAIAKLVPAVWDDATLTAARKTRLDLAMKGCMVGACYTQSDLNPWARDFSTARTIWGFQAGVTNAVNFTTPPKLLPLTVARFLGVATAQAFLGGFDRDAFHAALVAAGGLGKMALTFSQDWTPALADAAYGYAAGTKTGPTEAQLHTAVRGYTYSGWGLDDAAAAAVMAEQLARNFNRTIQVGPTGWGGSPYGIVGTGGELRAVIADTGSWAGLPNAGLIGAPDELDTVNGGYTPRLRSSMSYVAGGLAGGLAGWVALAAQGLHLGREAALAEGSARMLRGMIHVRYLTRHGFRSYAKGGPPSTNNEDWTEAWAAARGYQLRCRWGLGDALLSALTGARVDTAALLP